MNNFIERWMFSMNHEDIGTLYRSFSVISKVMEICFSIVICMKLAQYGNQNLGGNHQLYDVLITTHAILTISFYGYAYDNHWIW